ncbi:hypothetical protein CCP3SC1_80022 [Gammaproteobacteria bacterium]
MDTAFNRAGVPMTTVDDAKRKLYDTTFLLGRFRRRVAIQTLAGLSDPVAMVLLAEALGENHPNSDEIQEVLQQLSLEQDAEKVVTLWVMWGQAPHPALAVVLAKLGWPPTRSVEMRIARDVLAAATAGVSPEILRAVIVLVRSLPVADEALNDAIYVAWIHSQSEELGRVITEQGRQPGNPALEALHALVMGCIERYTALQDEDGELLVQAFAVAPPLFRERMARAVASSSDRRIKDAYRWALSGGDVDDTQAVANLKLVGDEDGLFERTRTLPLEAVLELCEHWANSPNRPSRPKPQEVVNRAVTAYHALGQHPGGASPRLPEGLVDIFDYWHRQQPSDAELYADLQAEDPFRKARGLYLGYEHKLVEHQHLVVAAHSEHWPERLVARLIAPAILQEAKEDHVLWVSVCAGGSALLQTPIDGTPEDYHRYQRLRQKTRGAAAVRIRTLLEILCAFQGAFVASGISIDETAEAAESSAIEVEDAAEEF